VEVSLSGMAVSDVALNATAGTHLSTLETGSGCKFCVSAIATTLPHYIACAVSILGRMDGNESAKAYVCDICVSGHRSAPAVRGQVAGSALPTLTSPRTISPVVLGS
jgi:hypothetical protein